MTLLKKPFMFCVVALSMVSCVWLVLPVRAIATHTLQVVYYQAYIYDDHDLTGAGEWHFRLGAAGQSWTDYYERSVDGPGMVDIWFVSQNWPISGSTEFYCQAREEDGLAPATYWGYTSTLTVFVPYPWPSVNVWHYGSDTHGDVTHYYRYLIENLAPTAGAISGSSTGSPGVPYTYSTTGSDPEGDVVTFEWSVNGVIVPKLMGPSLVYTFPTIGTYTVQVRAKDSFGAFSGYRSKTVTIGAESILFEDGFESGNFNAWNSISESSGETATVVSTLKHHGACSARFTSNGGGGTENADCRKTITSSAELYARGYFYVSQSGIMENNDRLYFAVLRAGGNNVACAGWRNVGGVVKWCLMIKSGTTNVFAYSKASPSLHTWYCVELHWKNDATGGLGELWVNGGMIRSITDQNTAAYGNVNQARFGLPQIYNCASTTAYCDCVKIATTYIGPET